MRSHIDRAWLSILLILSLAVPVVAAEGNGEWFAFRPSHNHDAPSEIGMQDWTDGPAGKHGRIKRVGEQLVYNGKPIKLWGLNLCYGTCAPNRKLADKRARFYAKYGINSVRLHKYADGNGWAGIQSPQSFVDFHPVALERMDYQVAQFKKHGIFTKLSSTFIVKLGLKDKARVPYMAEFGAIKGKNGRVMTGHGSIFFSTEIQDLQIEQVVKLLKHKNAHTGLTYAEDPAIAVVELFNEDSALWYGAMAQLAQKPTLRKRASERFFKWLKARYKTKEGLLKAWGNRALNSFRREKLADDNWEGGRINPAGNPWFYDPSQIAGSQSFRKQRLLDTMLFLYELQNEFYARYVKAIRDTGYKGEILASNWVAGRGFSHFYNLHSDYKVGLIDRHNYAKPADTMLKTPGSSTLGTGLQQVADRPFMVSEWNHDSPSLWSVEGPALIGAYGMGLQGWDVSYMFQNGDTGSVRNHVGRERWDVTTPQIIGVFPAVARQVRRQDVKQSTVLAPRRVHVPSLHEGKIGFDDKVSFAHDVKSYDSAKVPAAALAAARCVIEFTDTYKPTPTFDLSKHLEGRTVVSSTGQLRWTAGQKRFDGHFTVNTAGTRAVVGFARDQVCKLGDVTITPRSRYGAIYVTAKERDKTIASSRNLLIVAIARGRNTGAAIKEGVKVSNAGKPPLVLEPLSAEIQIKKPGSAKVIVLDHSGRRTEKTIPVQDGKIQIDTGRDKTCYYLVTYDGLALVPGRP